MTVLAASEATGDLAAAEPLLEVRSVNKVYGNGTIALRDASFTVAPGEFVSLVGASGCGKSTLLRMIAGLGDATTGDITIRGLTPKKALQSSGEMTFVFQEATLMPWRTVLGNVELPMELRGISGVRRREAAMNAISLVGLNGFEGVYPRELSGGMKMRVSLARAFALRPRLLLMDEPFGALDEITRQRLNEELLHLWEETGTTVIFVTHSVFEAVFLSTRVLVMTPRPGRILADMPISLSGPRDDANRRTSVEFIEAAARVSAALRHDG